MSNINYCTIEINNIMMTKILYLYADPQNVEYNLDKKENCNDILPIKNNIHWVRPNSK